MPLPSKTLHKKVDNPQALLGVVFTGTKLGAQAEMEVAPPAKVKLAGVDASIQIFIVVSCVAQLPLSTNNLTG